MQLKRNAAPRLLKSIQTIQGNENFSISTKYKLLKIKEILLNEVELNQLLMNELVDKYGELNENGEILIKKEFIQQVNKEINQFNSEYIILPDLKFTLEELNNDISWEQLEAFLPFIVD